MRPPRLLSSRSLPSRPTAVDSRAPLPRATRPTKASTGAAPRRPGRHAATQPQRPGHQELRLSRRRGGPSHPGPDHRRAAARQRGVRGPASGLCPTRADHGRRLPSPDPQPQGPLRDGQRVLHDEHRQRHVRHPRGQRTEAGRLSAQGRPIHVQAHRPRHLPALRRRWKVRSPAAAVRGWTPGPARTPSGRSARSARASRSPCPAAAFCPRAERASPSAAGLPDSPWPAPPAAGAYPEAQIEHQRRPARRASRRSRRSAATSTVTPTAWPSSSSAAMSTAAVRGTSTARRTRCATARPRAHPGLRRHPRDLLLRRARSRPGRLADVQGLAGTELADPRGHLLPLARALLARRPAAVRQPAGREQQALRDLPAEAQLVRRHGLHPAAGARHVQDAGLHRRPVRRPRQGFLPDRQDPVAGPQGDQRRQDGHRHGHRDQRAVRLHVQGSARQRRPGLHRRRTSTASSTRCTSLGVRQMELVNKFDNALAGVAGDNGSTGVAVNSANFLETGTFWDMRHCEPADGESSDHTQLALPDIGAGQQDALFGAIGKLFGGLLPALPVYGRPLHCNRRGLSSLGALHHRRTGQAGHDLRPRPPEREGAAGVDEPDREARLPRRHLQSLLVDARCVSPDLQGGRLHHPLRRRLDRLRREVAPPPRLGRQALLLRLRLRRGHQRARRAGQPARRQR